MTLTGVTPNTTYYLKTVAATAPGAYGAYGLLVNFGSGYQSPIAPPNTVVAAQPDRGGGSAESRSRPGIEPGRHELARRRCTDRGDSRSARRSPAFGLADADTDPTPDSGGSDGHGRRRFPGHDSHRPPSRPLRQTASTGSHNGSRHARNTRAIRPSCTCRGARRSRVHDHVIEHGLNDLHPSSAGTSSASFAHRFHHSALIELTEAPLRGWPCEAPPRN